MGRDRANVYNSERMGLVSASKAVIRGVALLVLSASSALAQPVVYDLDGSGPLLTDGFFLHEDKPSMSFEAGSLRIETSQGYSEWMLRDEAGGAAATSGWLLDESTARGYRVETRVQLVSRDCFGTDGPGVWIDDGLVSYRLHFLEDAVQLTEQPEGIFALDTTGAPHVYRIESPRQGLVRLFVDDAFALELQLSSGGASVGGQRALMFGDLGGCMSAASIWGSFGYDVFGASGAPGDQDDDGVDDADDDCVLLADATQADMDGDGAGDACDACPADADGDEDHDGTCTSDDPCPGDTRNDQNMDGVCDVMQCQSFESTPQFPGGNCPVFCNCQFVGIDPVGPIDNFAGSGGTSGGAGSGSAGSAGSAGMGSGMGVGVGSSAGTGGAALPAPGSGSTGNAGAGVADEDTPSPSMSSGCSITSPVHSAASGACMPWLAAFALWAVRRRSGFPKW